MATQNLGTMSDSVLQDYHTKRHTSGVDTEDLEATLAQVHNGESRTNWMLARYDPKDTQKLLLLAKGEGGFEELLGSLDDSLVIYGCFMFAAAVGTSVMIKRVPAPATPAAAPRRLTRALTTHLTCAGASS